MQYRKEIDGLRAIAVLPVILFHAGIQGFGGGYIGVDIFFVISGYLITSIILEEQRNNKFSIINFYERRARRILPALSVVLICTTLAGYLLMPANLLQEYSQSVVSVASFSSNVFFYLKSGYFSTASDEKPLLHTWSLAVEEQYYLFFPVMVVLFWSLGRKFLISIILFIATLSLLVAQFMAENNAVDANFYLIFSRAWELFFGAIVAFILLQQVNVTRWKSELLSIFGFAMIAYSVIFFNDKTPFPSFYALIPTLGASLVIVFSNSTSYVGRILSTKILVAIGLISYSLYLWHHPLFAFLRLKSIGEPSVYLFMAAIISAFILAFVSWKYIESPFRNKTKFTKAAVFKYSGISITVFLALGLVGHFNRGFESRFATSIYNDSIKFSPKRNECHTKGTNYLRPNEACKYFGGNITWASFGDSHIVEPTYALARKLEASNEGLVHLSFSGCPPSLLFEVKNPGCTKWINEALNYLENTKTIKNVLVGFRYTAFLYGEQLDAYPYLPNINPASEISGTPVQLDADQARELYWLSFKKIILRLINSGKNIYILYPIPELPIDINKAVAPFSVLGSLTILDLNKATSVEYYNNRNAFIIKKLDTLAYGENLHAVKPLEIICDSVFCPAVKDNKALYFDDDHLSISGAELIAENIDMENKSLANVQTRTVGGYATGVGHF